MPQIILCTDTDCIHNKPGYTGHDHCYETRCHEPDGVLISTTKGCLSKNCFRTELGLDTTTRENIHETLNKMFNHNS